MIVSVLDTEAGLHALEPDWRALWHRAGRPAFLGPDWLLPWWAAFGTGRPRIAVLHGEGELLGLLPLYWLEQEGERKLLPLGIGISDYHDALLDPTIPRHRAAELLQAALAGQPATSCALPELAPGAALAATPPPEGWHEAPGWQTPCPVLTLGTDPRASVPPGMLRNLRQSRHRADRLGGWRAEIVASAQGWDALLRLHTARWQSQGEAGVLADPAVRAFHAAALPRLGEAQLHVLHVGEVVAAVYYVLAEPGRLLFYLSGFDAACSFASPGTLLLGHLVEQMAAGGGGEMHFLRGQEAYKYAWGAVDRVNTSRVLVPKVGGFAPEPPPEDSRPLDT